MNETVPFHIDATMTAASVGYKNPAHALIADRVLPSVAIVTKKFRYKTYNDDTFFNLPDATMGRTSKSNQVNIASSSETSDVADYGLHDKVPMDDINQSQNASQNAANPLMDAAMHLTSLIQINREKRVADLVQDNANYGSDLVKALSGASRWDNDASDPVKAMLEALDKPLMRPNKIIFGQEAWTQLRLNENVAKRIYGANSAGAIITPQALADVLMVNEVIIGSSYMNTAKRGKEATLKRVWGKNVAMLYIDPSANAQGGITWGFTAAYRHREVMTKFDDEAGLGGSTMIQVGESCRELMIAKQAGFLFKDVIE